MSGGRRHGALVAERARIVAQVKQILVERVHLDVPPEAIDPDAPLFGTGLGLDSVDAIELVISAEQAFGIAIPQSKVKQSLRTLNTFVDLILSYERQKSRA